MTALQQIGPHLTMALGFIAFHYDGLENPHKGLIGPKMLGVPPDPDATTSLLIDAAKTGDDGLLDRAENHKEAMQRKAIALAQQLDHTLTEYRALCDACDMGWGAWRARNRLAENVAALKEAA